MANGRRFSFAWQSPWLLTAILLLGVIVRLPTLVNLPMWLDEVWTMWQTQGSLAQTIQLTPYDWPPGYYVLMRGWTMLVGHNDITGRYLSLLCGLLAIALMYRAGAALVADRRLGAWIGGFAALITAVLPYTSYLTIEAKGYALLAVAIPLTLWQHFRVLRRPTVWRAIGYGLALLLCLYTSYTGLIVIGFSLAHSVLCALIDWRAHRRSLVVAWLIALGVLIVGALPLSVRLLSIVALRRQNIVDKIAPPGLNDLLSNFGKWLAGGQSTAVAIIVAAASIGLIGWLLATRWRDQAAVDRSWRRRLTYLALWAIVAPVVMYVFRSYLILGAIRYLFYMVPGIILVVALGLTRWPRPLRILFVLPILVYVLSPLPTGDYRPALSDDRPLRDLVRDLGRYYQPGDALWVDPACACGDPFEWSYYESIYSPGGVIQPITSLAEASTARRVWYVSDQRGFSQANLNALAASRAHTSFFGPPYLIADLYETPPQTSPVRFGARLRFYGADLPRITPLHPGDSATIRLWWSLAASSATPDTQSASVRDLTASLLVLDPITKAVVARIDGVPTGSPAPGQPIVTGDKWPPGVLVVESRTFDFPPGLASGNYPVQIVVGDRNGQPIRAESIAPDGSVQNTRGSVVSLGTLAVFHPYTYSH